jgi:hypothetical protein
MRHIRTEPVSPIFEDRRGNDGWLLAAVIVLITALIAVIAGTALAATEAAPEEKGDEKVKTVCRAIYEGAGRKELARYDITIDADPATFRIGKINDVVKSLVSDKQKWTGVYDIPVGTVTANLVCPLVDGELTVSVTKH